MTVVGSVARLRTLEEENRRLKKLLAESMLDVSALKDLLVKKLTRLWIATCVGEARMTDHGLSVASRPAGWLGQPVGVAI